MLFDQMILGEDVVYSTDSKITGLNNNVLVCGSSGSGKTMSVIEPRLLETYHNNLVVTVTKRRLVKLYTPLFEKRGYEVLDLNFVKPGESKVAYDPLMFVKDYTDVRFFASSVVGANPRKSQSNADPYWDDVSISLLSAEIAYVIMKKPDATFADVLDFHDRLKITEDGGSISTNFDERFDELAKEDPSCFAVTCWKSFRQLPIKTALCVYSALNTTLDTIFSPDLRKMIEIEDKIDIKKLATKKTVLFVSTSAVNPALNAFINSFYGQMFKQLFELAEGYDNGHLPIPLHVLCDDFATGSPIQLFPEYISILREKLISVMILVQSESQLEAMYGESNATTIINNCDTYVFTGSMDLMTGRSISARLNVPLDEVLYMPVGEVVLFRRGQPPIKTVRFNTLAHEQYELLLKNKERVG